MLSRMRCTKHQCLVPSHFCPSCRYLICIKRANSRQRRLKQHIKKDKFMIISAEGTYIFQVCIFSCVDEEVSFVLHSDPMDLGSRVVTYLQELEGGLEVLDGVHLDPEELDSHDEANGALDHVGALLLLPQLLQLTQEPLLHCREPGEEEEEEDRTKP